MLNLSGHPNTASVHLKRCGRKNEGLIEYSTVTFKEYSKNILKFVKMMRSKEKT